MGFSAWWWLLFLAAGFTAWWLTGVLRRYALARNVIDVPNARSSHKQPTPRGGGIAFVVCFLGGLSVFWLTGNIAPALFWGVFVACAGVALIGFLDDHGHIQARWRLLAHLCAAAWVIAWLGGIPVAGIGGFPSSLGWLGVPLALLYLGWLINLYNFMDGIDGLASVEAICVAGGGALLYALAGGGAAMPVAILLVAVVAGFLVWNAPPAKIFMGDGASGFLGLLLGALSLQAGWDVPELFWGWLILLGVFIVDATVTLLTRLLRGEKVYEAHRTHAYQYASRRWQSHRCVTVSVLLINLFWLLPLAGAVVLGWLPGIVGVLLSYAPLVAGAIWLRAGRPELAQLS